LLKRCRTLEQRFGERSPRSRAPKPPSPLETGDLEKALQEIAARRADVTFPRLRHFRARRGGVIKPEAVESWVETRAEAALNAAGPTLWIEVPVEIPPDGLPRANARLGHLQSELERMKTASEWRLGRQRLDTLSYPKTDGSVGRVPIARVVAAPDCPREALVAWQELNALRAIVEELMREFSGWSEVQAVAFALTGVAPEPARGWVTPQANAVVPSLGTVRLELSPFADPQRVVELFRQARTALLQAAQRVRAPRPEQIELARFGNALEVGVTWAEAMRRWNARERDRKYRDWRAFRRDAHSAYRHVTGGLELERGPVQPGAISESTHPQEGGNDA
jgi:hypothetical protein